ncbi:hypothetical protein WA158_005387 [Blastocystis sp. Blastoise]
MLSSYKVSKKGRCTTKRIILWMIFFFLLFFITFYVGFLLKLKKEATSIRGTSVRKNRNGKKLLTIFTTVMPADDDPLRKLAQENSLRLLSKLNDTNVIVFTEYKYWIQFSKSLNLEVVQKIKKNSFGTPFLKGMYQDAFDLFESYFYGYVNADILFDNMLISSLYAVRNDIELHKIKPKVLIVGQRTNVQHTLDATDIYTVSLDPITFVTSMLLRGHRYWDSAIDYQIVTRATLSLSDIPDFVIGRSGYDIWLIQYAYLRKDIVLIDATNTVHCAHLLSKEGNRSGLKRETPDRQWNRDLMEKECCPYSHFVQLAEISLVQYKSRISLVPHLVEGYYDDSYYETELHMIQKYILPIQHNSCLLISEGDILGLLEPYCEALLVVVIGQDSCQRTHKRFQSSGLKAEVACIEKGNDNKIDTNFFYQLDDMFDTVIIHSDKPLKLINWLKNQIKPKGILIMRHWLDPREQKDIQKAIKRQFILSDLLQAPPDFDKTHDEHFGMAVFTHK